jgi:uroporphyrinogen decarboxylase
MNSRERVMASMNYQQPDKVPIDFGGYHSSSIMAIAYAKLRDYLGLEKRPIKVYDVPQQLAIIDDDVLDRFNVDVIEMGRGFNNDDADWKEWVLPDGTECLIPKWVDIVRDDAENWVIHGPDGTPIAIQKKGMVYFDQIHFPYATDPEEKIDRLEELFDYNMWTAVVSPPGPHTWDEEGMRYLAEGAKKLRESTDRAIIAINGGSIFEMGQMFFRNDNWYMALAAEPDLIHRWLDKIVEIYMKRIGMFMDAVGPYIDIYLHGDDYGMQTGPQISPAMFREFFKPRHKKMWYLVKSKNPDIKVKLHSCGSINALLPDMIDAGLDAVNPVQTNCKLMEPERLKSQFRDQITFWGGGCNTQHILPKGTPEEVREDVFHNLDILFPGGGFVFQQIHNIQADVPPENIVAMFDAVAEWNKLNT